MAQKTESRPKKRLPDWFKSGVKKRHASAKMSNFLNESVPNTVCQEAKCPNRGECFSSGQLTFLILGTVCTRNCKFCSIRHGQPMPPDPKELEQIFNAIEKLSLRFVVLTSPNRDDLPDGGASHYHHIVSSIKKHYPHVKTEVLIPDFQGRMSDIDIVIDAGPDVINHNLETVPSLYTTARKGSLYKRSLDVLHYVKDQAPQILSKTGVMLGLGEEKDELLQVFEDVAAQKVDILTLGQYLKPTKDQLEVEKYYSPEEFEEYKIWALEKGIRHVFSGPLVRSSYLAEHVFDDLSSLAAPKD